MSDNGSLDFNDYDVDNGEGGDNSSNGDTSYKASHNKPKRKSAAGRKLVRWDPDKDQLILLAVDYECTKNGITVPWDAVAAHVASYLTGEGIKQHLAKVYKFRVEEGHKVPPKLDRNQRRKTLPSANSTPAPVRSRGGGGRARARAAVEQGEDGDAPYTPSKPGRSLLFKKPEPTNKRAKAAVTVTPKMPSTGARGGRRKKASPGDYFTNSIEINDEVVSIKSEPNDDDAYSAAHFVAPKKKAPAPRGMKRGRKSKTRIDDEEDEDDTGVTTPTKKSKAERELRSLVPVDYSKQLVQNEDVNGSDLVKQLSRKRNSTAFLDYLLTLSRLLSRQR
ncbi:hypothetical protein BAUCODRAFT_435379 [Baudoinia panamericana UAMH 10762]|uniref:Myb-like domain-containing protein n=1 Tax=Baudoinia panamericana (strain UAMH 10762) TaxID=717646 RepID=M2MZI0_BAUPA|nr:uncharacterized protein BAUCODRAFT_435379 [Baudoinia panamericana UAMH 10762]EMC97003.1 hypothetical protein BAUCODRAFT_435379 [Baudoinia panamericana UAMH 10762]